MNKIFENLFIFEMANNHQGSVEHGIKIIKAMSDIARKYKINAAIKLQYRDLDTFIHPSYVNSSEPKHIKRFQSTRLKSNEFLKLINVIKQEGLLSMVTPFDEISVQLAFNHDVDIIKIASSSANDWPLLEEISKTKKPVICSSGGLRLKEIDNVISFLDHRNVDYAFMHCVSIYPTDSKNVNANFIEKLRLRYPYLQIGYSGHESPNNTDVIKIVIAKGAKLFERHVGFETKDIKLNKYSMNPKQAENWVKSALTALEICGKSQNKEITQEERKALNSLKRGVFVKEKVLKGERLSRDKVFFAFPIKEGQTSTFDYSDMMVSTKDYNVNDPVFEKRSGRNNIDKIREIVHSAKGFLNEAGIPLAEGSKFEISHHYGIDNFYETGAVLVDVVNRSYCKKLIIVFPGQRHPSHAHKIKEETFQLLFGDLEVTINGNSVKKLRPGDILLIEPNTVHSFVSSEGAIFEEISSTHIVGDSYYEDEYINKLDSLERKTIIDSW